MNKNDDKKNPTKPSSKTVVVRTPQPYYKLEKSEHEHYLDIKNRPEYQDVLITVDFLHREMDKICDRQAYVATELKRLKEGGISLSGNTSGEIKGLLVFQNNLNFLLEEFSRIASSAITSHKTVRPIKPNKGDVK